MKKARTAKGPGITVTAREAAVLELVARGLSTQEIATSLFVSRQTVAYHIGNLLRKFQTANRAGLTARAFVAGVLSINHWPPSVQLRTDPVLLPTSLRRPDSAYEDSLGS